MGPALGLDDQILELAINANRPDGLSMVDIAREVAALTGGTTHLPEATAAVAAAPLPVSPQARGAMEGFWAGSLTPELMQRLDRPILLVRAEGHDEAR